MSQKGVSPLRFGVPNLPPPPYPGEVNFFRWVQALYVELELHFAKMREQLVDIRGILYVDTQVVTTNFSIEPKTHFVDIKSSAAVSSHPTLGIEKGAEGQSLVITNIGPHPITLMVSLTGLVYSPLGNHITIPSFGATTLKWDDTAQHWTQVIML